MIKSIYYCAFFLNLLVLKWHVSLSTCFEIAFNCYNDIVFDSNYVVHRKLLSPWFISGFVDAEGSFSFYVRRNKNLPRGWQIRPRFNLTMHIRELSLLKDIQKWFGGIGVIKTNRRFCYFDVNSVRDLSVIIAHFVRYPLQSQKNISYLIFVEIYNIYRSKKHLTLEGFLLCVRYINVLNKPLNPETIFSITKVWGPLPKLVLPPILANTFYLFHPQWIVGFVRGDGCFSCFKSRKNSPEGFTYSMVFEVSQLPCDNLLLSYIFFQIIGYIGKVYLQVDGVSRIRVWDKRIIQHYILPFFHLHPFPVNRYKRLQYSHWLAIAETILKDPIKSKSRSILLDKQVKRLSALK